MSERDFEGYQDLPLSSGRKSIRILKVLPGVQDEPLSAVLEVQDLSDTEKESYACLSYVWGNLQVTEPITVNNETLHVTTNLACCLRHLRHQNKELILWVDAVCINQNDLDEKSMQVAMMGEIYSRCSTVYLWLGAPKALDNIHIEPHQDPFALLRQLASNCHIHELPGFKVGQSPDTITFQEDEICLATWEAALLVVNSPWFTRSWTVQETILPLDAIAVLGCWRMSFEDITIARQNRNSHLFSPPSQTCRCYESWKVLPNRFRMMMDHFLSRIEDLEMFRYIQHRDNVVHAHEYRAGSSLFDGSGNSTIPFLELVLTFASRQCQNPRDKIFSLVAMATAPAYDAFVPDYHTDTVTCYIDIFRQMLEECKYDFQCFVGSRYGSPSLDLSGLPSWACDFSRTVQDTGQELRRRQVYNLYNACGAKTGSTRVHNQVELHLSGVYVDTIKQVDEGSGSPRTSVDPQALFARWIDMCEHAIGSTDQEQVRRAMVRVLCGTVVADWDFRRTRDKDGAEEPCLPNESEWKKLIGGDLHAIPPAWETGFSVAVDGRRFFITEGGKMGLAVQDAREGDEVWVPFGSRVPFVLRRLPLNLHTKDVSGLPGTHSFVGDCFLENAMDGEAVANINDGETIVLL